MIIIQTEKDAKSSWYLWIADSTYVVGVRASDRYPYRNNRNWTYFYIFASSYHFFFGLDNYITKGQEQESYHITGKR